MKKMVVCAAIGTIFMCEGMNEGALVLRDSSSNAIARSEILESEIRRQEQESKGLITREDLLINSINYREISNPTVNGDQVTVKVQDFVEDELVGESYNRSYPLQKRFLDYSHDFEKGVSHPVEELFAVVDDLEYSSVRGKIVANSRFINEEESFTHQLRINKNLGQNGYQMNDNGKKATPFMETFISKGDWEEVIGDARLHEDKVVAYEKVDGSLRVNDIGPRFSKPGDNSFDYQRQEVLEDWKRPDGSIFTSRTPKEKRFAKPKPPAPVPAPAPQVVNQPAPSGGPSNELERLGGAVGRGDCSIM